MLLKTEFLEFSKEKAYATYLRIVYINKDYDDISKNKMYNEIIKMYKEEKFLFNICTTKELIFLKMINNKEITEKDKGNYAWEINELNKKCIFSQDAFLIFEEQKEIVNDALKEFESYDIMNKIIEENIIMFSIANIRICGELSTIALSSIIENGLKLDKEIMELILSHPLFHFYCEVGEVYEGDMVNVIEMINYRDYYDFLDDLFLARKEFGMSGTVEFSSKEILDYFYYGFPIENKKVEKMFKEILKREDSQNIFDLIEYVRVLNTRYMLNEEIEDKTLLNIINEALDETKCAAMNGFTPNQYKLEKIKDYELSKHFVSVPQNNAHLCKNAANLFYKIYFALLEYTNNHYQITEKIKKIYLQENIDVDLLLPINDYLWNHKEILDKFIEENVYDFDLEELEIVNGFKSAITEIFTIIGFEREHTLFLSDNGKIFMVKGIRTDFDELISSTDLPQMVETTLLMFKNNIVYNGFISTTDIKLGNEYKELVLKDFKDAMKYYHL